MKFYFISQSSCCRIGCILTSGIIQSEDISVPCSKQNYDHWPSFTSNMLLPALKQDSASEIPTFDSCQVLSVLHIPPCTSWTGMPNYLKLQFHSMHVQGIIYFILFFIFKWRTHVEKAQNCQNSAWGTFIPAEEKSSCLLSERSKQWLKGITLLLGSNHE